MTTTIIAPRDQLSALDLAIAEVAALEALCDRLGSGIAEWREWDEALTCPDRQEVAYRECEQALDEARERLARLRAEGGQV